MTRLLRAEVQRSLATSVVWWLLTGAVVLAVASSAVTLAVTERAGRPLTDEQTLQAAMHGAVGGALFVLVAGVLAVAGEYRSGQADQTFLTTPRRRRLIAAKLVVGTGTGLLFGLAAGTASLLTTVVWISHGTGQDPPLDQPVIWSTLLGAVLAAGLYGALGVAVGAITRSAPAAIVITLAWMVVVEPTLLAALDAARWLPASAGLALSRAPDDGLLPAVTGGVVLALYVLVAAAAAAALTDRRDVRA